MTQSIEKNTSQDNVPFHSQKWDLDNWKALGFESYEDAKYWEESSCGVLCLKMAHDYYYPEKKDSVSIKDMIDKGLELGAYTHKYGWSHAGLAELAGNFGIEAMQRNGLRPRDFVPLIDQGSLVIVSIKTAFRKERTLKERLFFWKKYGGHLALVIGHSNDDLIIHHTSIRKDYNWKSRTIEKSQFMRGFTGRALELRRAQ